MWKTGHSLIKSKMKETQAPARRRDERPRVLRRRLLRIRRRALRRGPADRRLGAARQVGHRAQERDARRCVNTPELRFQVDESRKFAAIEEVKARLEGTDADVNDTDGVRVTTPDGWWLLRASNTQDVLVARAESYTDEGLARLLEQIDEQLEASGLERGPQAGH